MALEVSALMGTNVKILKTQGGWKAKPLVVMLSGDQGVSRSVVSDSLRPHGL